MAPRDGSDYLGSDLLGEGDGDGAPRSRSRPSAFSASARRISKRTTPSKDTRMVVGVDFGTTFTGVAFAQTQSNVTKLDDIEVIQEWTSKMSNQNKVPSVYSYSKPKHREAQWGSDISDDAITMVNVKLDLQPQDSRLAELESALGVLRGTDDLSFDNLWRIGSNPAYPTKTPAQIIADYLTKVCECACRTIEPENLALTKTPLDLVVTVPVNWSYEANNATFRALRTAGFNKKNFPTLNDMILISEPEAASYFTVQHLQARKAEFLKVGDCFVLCDAGGGTVDVVAFQITAETPHTELKRVTVPTSRKCGSAYIDAAFKTWLRDTALGARYYSKLDPADKGQRIKPHSIETGPMRELIKRFEVEKTRFSTDSHDVRLELPPPLDRLNIEGRVKEGEITIYKDEMRRLFNPCINEVVGLIEQQMKHLSEAVQRGLKSVLLVGGFGASPYLQGILAEALELRKIKMHRPDPDKSWTAVVQGAVVYGIEKSRHPDATLMREITNSYGIVPYDAFDWMVRKGDLIATNQDGRVSSKYFWVPSQKLEKRKLDFKVYRYPSDDDDVPESLQSGMHDVEEPAVVSCDLSRFVNRISRKPAIGPLKADFVLSGQHLVSEVSFSDTVVGTCTIDLTVGL